MQRARAAMTSLTDAMPMAEVARYCPRLGEVDY